jgi:negative regulator of flagellin synthesis FlgM
MKIHGGKGTENVDLYIKNKVSKKGKQAVSEVSSEPNAKDSVEISQAGADIRKAKEVINEQPEVRINKVQNVKNEVDEGAYKVNGEKVAEKIIKQNVLDELL